MRHILFLLSLQSIQLSSSFDLPQPLDNFYDEVVRFYKRLRQEGVKTCGVPVIDTSEMGNRSVRLGDKVTFNCKVDLSCMVSTIRWYHEMENGTEILIKTPASPGVPNIYTIRRVSSLDQGMYTCVAKNVVGKAYVAAYLQVASSSQLFLDLRLLLVLLFVYTRLLFSFGSSSVWSDNDYGHSRSTGIKNEETH